MGIVAVLVIVLLVFFIVRVSHHRIVAGETCVSEKPASAENSAMKILNERYAKGEITDEEYKNKKSNIL